MYISDSKDHKTVADFVQVLTQQNSKKRTSQSHQLRYVTYLYLKALEKIYQALDMQTFEVLPQK
ncbi:hypothetical protein [uncultured Gammaproteobacteria bacterium]|nr:hypothetical protein [uncultured Gammaproteobacteria bacterium]SSC10138.1 hypothetical protein BPUTEOSOX_1692 [thiotrophic endosymbiont of Bathymodiolus puteoserpentis (Logatchev)]CAC9578883.1 hypothetical protein [uncultured Gammaproteobacteria bacterium]CAC9630819.1 hypothetical protein [uncultured Gammaproteobacteria bacterium]CAC9645695.1 hypothetical protein [uncultured Gammaproteobacteria bacterium]